MKETIIGPDGKIVEVDDDEDDDDDDDVHDPNNSSCASGYSSPAVPPILNDKAIV